MNSSTKFIHALNLALGGEPQALLKALNQTPNPETAWRKISHSAIDPDREMEKLVRAGIWLVDQSSKDYPPLLKEIHDAPAILYIKGKLPWKHNETDWTIGIVGTRKPTEYGKFVARQFGEELAEGGAIIVSGLATGIDREAHVGALKARGRTVAVIGSGLDRDSFFPQANWAIAETIIKDGGAVISEYPPGAPALPHHFPERNRIIAGLAQGIIIVEAQEKSGALITARLAMEENRDVFAIPGPITSLTSRGPNLLIKEGATPALSPNDLFEAYGRAKTVPEAAAEALGELEAKILEALREPCSLDDLKTQLKEDTAALQASLSLLELKNKIFEVELGIYSRRA
ncbi:MAG: DNA-protecting protein DprA [Candidatus Sungbacteria bacterium]|uniref:DNA-protecting protein DprA n=1 Tax=Candidatus Sungiibacteriota bacterium TaxID=2750080 RepID=A0A931SD15_9BACT|nr:DNA-protecting protein DprA [Candidatus Sungbacteria bacterium]